MYASTEEDAALPEWLHFNPVSRGFYGTAPSSQTFKVQLRAINQYSHTSQSGEFRLTVLPNSIPKTNLREMSEDITVYTGDWIEHTLSIQLFMDYEANINATITMHGGYGLPPPEWI